MAIYRHAPENSAFRMRLAYHAARCLSGTNFDQRKRFDVRCGAG